MFICSLFVHFRSLVDSLCAHALMEFVEEECTGVVPLKCAIGDSFQAGKRVNVLETNIPWCFLICETFDLNLLHSTYNHSAILLYCVNMYCMHLLIST